MRTDPASRACPRQRVGFDEWRGVEGHAADWHQPQGETRERPMPVTRRQRQSSPETNPTWAGEPGAGIKPCRHSSKPARANARRRTYRTVVPRKGFSWPQTSLVGPVSYRATVGVVDLPADGRSYSFRVAIRPGPNPDTKRNR